MVSNNHDGIRCVWKTAKPAYDNELYPAAYPTTSSNEFSLPRTGRATTRFASCPARKATTPSSSLTSTTDVRFSGTPRNQSSTAPHRWPPTSTAGAQHFRRATRPVRPLRDPVHQIRPQRPAGRAAPGHACGRSAAKHPRPRQCCPDAQLLAIQPHRARPLSTRLAELNPMRATSHHRATRRRLPLSHTPRTPERGFP